MTALREAWIALLALGLALSLGSGVAVAAPDLKAFFGPPTMRAAALSPSGQRLAAIVPGVGGRMVLSVIDLTAAQQPTGRVVASSSEGDVDAFVWVNDRRLLFATFDQRQGSSEQYGSMYWAVDADGTHLLGLGRGRLHSTLRDGSDDILVEYFDAVSRRDFRGTTNLFRMNTRTRHVESLSRGSPKNIFRWITDASGLPKVVLSGADGRRFVHIKEGEGWRLLIEFSAFEPDAGWMPLFWLQQEGLFAAVVMAGQDADSLARVVDSTNASTKIVPVLGAPGFDVGSNAFAATEASTGKLLGWHFETDAPATHWIDADMKAGQAAIDALLPGRVNRISCQRCIGAERWLVTSHSDRVPREAYLFEPETKRLALVSRSRPAIDPAVMGRRDFHRVRTRDGLSMPVYVTFPAAAPGVPSSVAAPASRAPAVVLVHGGPWSRVHWGWEAVAQFLASRGYVVIEPEFRGSSGYGHRHFAAGMRQWGLAMQDDLEDAVAAAVGKAWVDPNRVCIMGASYGGYAAMIGATRLPPRYRCAVSWVGVSDLALMHSSPVSNLSDEFLEYGFNRLVGDPVTDAARLRETSPVFRAAAIKVPVLAAWSLKDYRVPIEHGRRFRAAANAAGVALEYVEYENEGHHWLLEATRIDFFSRVERFLAKSLTPSP